MRGRLKFRASGQVATEFVIMLVLAVILAVSLMTLFVGFSQSGRRLIELVGFNLP